MNILKLENISKSFPGVKALDNVSLMGYEGEAMALLGENGAGKSTLIKILGGAYKKDEGDIYIDEKKVEISTVHDSQAFGISVIHQELNLIENMTVSENVFIGREPKKALGIIDKDRLKKETSELLKRLGVNIDPDSKVKNLSIASKQMVEIAKALSLDARIIVMDEPTDALTDKEVDKLFEVMKELKKQGKAIIYISHRLKEIFEICEKVTVLRDGKYIGEKPVSEINEETLINMMVGRDIKEQFPYVDVKTEEVLLELKDVSNEFVKNISLSLKKGEILGIAGLVGAGRTELAKTIYGAYPKSSGEIILKGQNIHPKSTKEGLDLGISYISEDRKKDGLVLIMSVKDNITLSSLDKVNTPFGIDKKKENEVAETFKKKMNIKTSSLQNRIKNLSGGNQQKASIAKGLMKDPDVLIMDEPTRGVDVGAKYEIYELMNNLKKEGRGIIMISSEMPEILGVSDRILVMHEGEIKGELSRDYANQESIMKLILS